MFEDKFEKYCCFDSY